MSYWSDYSKIRQASIPKWVPVFLNSTEWRYLDDEPIMRQPAMIVSGESPYNQPFPHFIHIRSGHSLSVKRIPSRWSVSCWNMTAVKPLTVSLTDSRVAGSV